MSRSFHPATDDDLLPSRERTFHELIADIRARVFAGVNDAAQDEDLRLFILGCQILNYTTPEIIEEAVGWGLQAETVALVIQSLAQTGGSDTGDLIEHVTVLPAGQFVTTDSAAATRRGVARRADRRYRLAARMVADHPRRVREDLQFDTRYSPPHEPTTRRGRGRLVAVWVAVMVAFVGLVGGCLWYGLMKR